MKKLLLSCLSTVFLLSAALFDPVQASHYIGSDFSYAPVPGMPGKYVLTLNFYRDCGGISINTAAINATSPGCTTMVYNLLLESITEVSEVCNGQLTECTGDNTIPGIQRYTFSGLVSLPAGCPYFIFSYGGNARNAGIVNIYNGNSQVDWYTTAMVINNMPGVVNSSPVYASGPVPYFCVNDTVTYSPQATDPDGDSLVYVMDTPLVDFSDPVTFTPGYTANQPFGTAANFTLDQNTGMMNFIPTLTGPFVLVLKVEEYRYINGVPTLVGSTRRDIQVQVMPCTTPCPMAGNIISVNGTGQSGSAAALVMVGQPLQISIPASSTNTNVTLTMTSNCASEIPGSAFTVNGTGSNVTGIFSWQPDSAHARIAPYYFTYHVKDNACPYPNERYGVVQVKVSPDTTILGAQPQLQVSEFALPNLLQIGSQWVLPAQLGAVDVQIRDVTGRLVFNQARYAHTFSGQGLGNGLYVYQLTIRENGQVISGKMQLYR
ncbi:MAG: hypothetical protein EOP51_21125 [Sphingobacteriales bacterium]|nr:MAG: hypothetical protein EOP51_21125 [Sphingobacteriales bacterium]